MFMLLFQMFGTVGSSGPLVCDVKRVISVTLRAAV